MATRKICIHGIHDPVLQKIDGFDVAVTTTKRDELRTAIGIEDVEAMILDLDADDAFDVIIETLEVKPHLAIVGVTGSNDVSRIIHAQRVGCRQFASRPLDVRDLITALQGALQDVPAGVRSGDVESKTFAVVGSTGGAGATTLSCYLSMALAEVAKTTALVDVDFEFGMVAKAWDLSPRHTIFDLCQFDEFDRQNVEDVMIELPSGVSVLPRPAGIQQGQEIDESSLKEIIGLLQTWFPYVVLDIPRRLDARTGCAIEMCDKLLIVCQQTVAGVLNAGRLTDGLLEFGMSLDQIEFVINRYNTKIHSVTADQLEKRVNKKPIGLVPNHYKSVGAASDLGEPVTTRNPVRKAIADIAAALSGDSSIGSGSRWVSSLGIGG
ncbi:MAG: AAA family ATPase [Phycisphaerales bacterium]|nr:AAA family ATPase [Phycisphaerales bacterium]MCB9862736.1 AAA family ATPase [Phycisphaerales bacterium]